jgi:hypothetical protein
VKRRNLGRGDRRVARRTKEREGGRKRASRKWVSTCRLDVTIDKRLEISPECDCSVSVLPSLPPSFRPSHRPFPPPSLPTVLIVVDGSFSLFSLSLTLPIPLSEATFDLQVMPRQV